MNDAVLQQLIRSTRYSIQQAKADLERTTALMRIEGETGELMHHQGYQSGRIAEMERFADLLEMLTSPVLVITGAIRSSVRAQPTEADVDQVIADTIAALWPAKPQAVAKCNTAKEDN